MTSPAVLPPGRAWMETDIGMPQLAPGGLSEAWLLKTCGHQHWVMLASLLGMPTPDFRAEDGSRLYAAFTAVRLEEGRLGAVREHGTLGIASVARRISRTQFLSRHALWANGVACGALEMLSVFVRRTKTGVNQSVERAIPQGRPCLVDAGADGSLAALARTFRKGDWSQAHGLKRLDGRVLAKHCIEPCPHTDFNGADFLYFASFQAFLDRAEWAWFGAPTALAHSRRREIVYYGNVEVGEAVLLTLKAAEVQPGRLVHWIELTEPKSGRRLADAISVRDGVKRLARKRLPLRSRAA